MKGSMRLVGKPDVWELRVYLGRDADGRVRHAHQRFRGTKRQAQHELNALLAKQTQTIGSADSAERWNGRTTLNDLLEAWRANGWEDLSPTTVRRYEGLWDRHVRNQLGKRPVASLSPYDFERFFRSLKKQGLSEGSVRYIRAVLNRACKLGRKWSGGRLPNPVADTELPKWSIDARETVRAPEPDEVRAMLAGAQDEDLRICVFLRVIAATGMRRGEACALRWSDIDTSHAVLTVDESVIGAKGGVAVKQPKTRASIRRVAVDSDTLDGLVRLRESQEELAIACETHLARDGFVFSFEPGGRRPPHPDVFSHGFSRIRDRAGVSRDVHLHSLRHFQATILDSIVSERQKQARLGWSTVQMARHYTDPVVDEDRRAAEHVRSVLASS